MRPPWGCYARISRAGAPLRGPKMWLWGLHRVGVWQHRSCIWLRVGRLCQEGGASATPLRRKRMVSAPKWQQCVSSESHQTATAMPSHGVRQQWPVRHLCVGGRSLAHPSGSNIFSPRKLEDQWLFLCPRWSQDDPKMRHTGPKMAPDGINILKWVEGVAHD